MEKKSEKTEKKTSGIAGIFSGLADLVEKLGELAETGEQLSKSGNLKMDSGGKNVKGVYGLSFRTGIGGEGVKVEPFGNVRKDAETGKSQVVEVREPMIDIFEEDGYTLVVAEMPGIESEDVVCDLQEDVLTIKAESGDKKYRKEVLLPREFDPSKTAVKCRNGIVEIRLS